MQGIIILSSKTANMIADSNGTVGKCIYDHLAMLANPQNRRACTVGHL